MAPASDFIAQLRKRIDGLRLGSSSPPQVVISSCLFGQPVRYDGGHKSLGSLNTLLAETLELHSVCPEVAANMGTPRPPVHWIETNSGERQLQQVDDPLRRFDQSLQLACRQQLDHLPRLDGAILKARSPSCGSSTTLIYSEQLQPLHTGDGIWAATLKEHQPDTLIIDESQLLCLEDTYWFILMLYSQKRYRERQTRDKGTSKNNRESKFDALTLLNCPPTQRLHLFDQVPVFP